MIAEGFEIAPRSLSFARSASNMTRSDRLSRHIGDLILLLRVEPGVAVFTNDGNGFFDRVHAMRDGEVDVAGEFVAFAEHRAATPLDEFGPHFADEDERRVVQFADLQELPRQRQLQQSSYTAWNNYERVGDNHEMV